MTKSKFGKPLCRLIMAVAIMMLSLQAMAYDFSYTHQGKTLYYEILAGSTNTLAVTYYSETATSNNHVSGDVVIPSTVEHNNVTYSVTSIGNSAFRECSGLTSVTIPNSVTSIGYAAFRGCSGLTSVSIPNSVTTIGESAFKECSGLTSLTIPNSVTYIGDYAFYRCSGLTSVTIPNSVSHIGYAVFQICSSLNSINVASGNTHYSSIDGVLYNYVQDILIQCPGAKTSVTIPNSVTTIRYGAFYRCSGLTSVNIPNSVTSIGHNAFNGCIGLTSVNIPNSVTSIEDWVFSACSGLTSITIPNGVTSIGDAAFLGCSGLTSVNIPNSVTTIGESPFADCSSLNSINVASGNTHYSSIDGVLYNYVQDTLIECPGARTSLTIPNSVTTIGIYAFLYCRGLTSITIPNSVISIGNDAFYRCSGLTSIKCLAAVPPSLGHSSFENISDTCTLTVPCGSLDAYTASDWNTYFATRISEDLSFELSVSANEEAYGKVEVETQSCNVKTLTAIANEGYEFTAWNDGNTENPRTVTITSDTAFMAIFTASGSSSLQEVNAREFALYPNPAKSFVNLEFEALKENTLLQILDLNGRRVRTFDLKAGVETLRIDVSDLSKGVYTIMLGNTTKKLIVE